MVRKITYWFILWVGFLTSCIHEKNDDCLRGVTLVYVFELHNDEGDLFSEQVDYVHVDIYDQYGVWIKGLEASQTSLNNGNSLTIPFGESGEYTFVTWGNIHTDDFILESGNTCAEMSLALTCLTEEGVLTKIDPGTLFHGINKIHVKSGLQYITEKVPLTKNSNIVRVEIGGVADPVNTQLEVIIKGRNGFYSHDNTIHPDSPDITYISEQWVQGRYMYALLPSYRLFAADEDMRIIVRSLVPNSEGILYNYEEPLVPILLKQVNNKHQEYLDKTDEFFVYVSFDDQGVGTGSTIPPWNDVGNNTEL